MKYNILIGGAAGQGMDTIATTLEKILNRSGFYVYSHRDVMSRVRGGHSFIQIRFGNEPIHSHADELDLIVALDQNTIDIHLPQLKSDGIIIADEALKGEDARVAKLGLMKIARDLKMPIVVGVVAAGAVVKYFGINYDEQFSFISPKFKENVKEANKKAFLAGYDLVDRKHNLGSGTNENHLLINGNNAIALGALAGGVSYYSAYPMTPATSIMTYLSKNQVKAGIVVEQAEDEIAAINMALGASYAGVRAMTGSSGGGFSLMVEALGLGGIAEIPLVVVDSQRPGPATGLPTRTEQSDLSFMLTASHGEFPRMVMSVRNAEDAFYQTFRALNLAEKYQTIVLLLTDQYVADSNITIPKYDLSNLKIEDHSIREVPEGEVYKRYKITESGISPRLIPGKAKGQVVLVDSDEHSEEGHIIEAAEDRNAMMEKRMRKAILMEKDMQEPEYFGVENPETLLVGWGSTYGPLKEAVETLNKEGANVGALSFGDLYPLPKEMLNKYKSIAKKVVNVEQNYTGQLGKLITMETAIQMDHSILKYDGRQINAEEICSKVRNEVL
ncbi:2-oxoacid:acceptor oxidoreductase subunit alpha [Clostridium polynesiense]|uniref:2-oxoacid:acceptor oxidoreductase subunit alpha n=1 Tax=Clostridium polynesiense TaxID=1325933 RepID=UPI00058D3C13|nr:2-oxoacid:acceptor oxidoreductase subunit alpha [Clostridium polynesiense]